MENQNLFELQIDGETTSFLSETARWAKFLAIVGFVMCGFMLLGGLFANMFMSSLANNLDELGSTYSAYNQKFTFFFYAVFGIISIFPYLYLYRFATRMQQALNAGDQDVLNSSFANLKSSFKFVGILTIIMLAFVVLAMIFAVIAVAARM